MIVVDTNVIAYLWIPGEATELSERLLRADAEWVAPMLWQSEFRNVVLGHVRRRSMTLTTALEIAEAAETHLHGREYLVDTHVVLRLAVGSSCSAYDCEFVALAEQLSCPLVTRDRKVLKAFPALARSPEDHLDALERT